MDLTDAEKAVSTARWDASLALDYAWRDGRTVLARREHHGPLRVQRDLYPEGHETCHSIIVHPPGGIAGGDTLAIRAGMGKQTAALLTTPGATKWYGTLGPEARQTLDFTLGAGAALEWLPQETIVFDGAHASTRTSVRLEEGSVYLGWEIVCLGRQASGETFACGVFKFDTDIWKGDVRLWSERAAISGGDALLDSPVGLAGHAVFGTLVAAGKDIGNATLAACRDIAHGAGAHAGVTRLPDVCIARWIGDSGEDARHYFAKLWEVLRPTLRARAAMTPRIWST
jgi:urease accessory protein